VSRLELLVSDTFSHVPVLFSDINTNFLTLAVTLFPTKLPVHLRPLLPLYLESFFSLPVVRADGTKLGFEEVVNQLDAGTVEYDIDLGAYLTEAVGVVVKVEKSKYREGIAWIRDLLWGSKFDLNRLKTIAVKLSQSLPAEKRDGATMSETAFDRLIYDPEKSNSVHLSVLNRSEYIKTLLARFDNEPEILERDLNELRDKLTDPSTLRISVTGDILSLDKPSAPWAENFRKIDPRPLEPVTMARDVLSVLGRKPERQMTIYKMSSIESSFSIHGTKGPDRFDHPDIPALKVTLSYLNALEGPLWRHIRGAGLVSVHSRLSLCFHFGGKYNSDTFFVLLLAWLLFFSRRMVPICTFR
jgi:Zn-dependent M16 (insulinase) family peptidase